MNIVCVICSELLIPSDDVFHTPCGHIFHFVCLTQWLERSRSCPQCREKTTSNKIHRIYFNLANSDTITEDTCSLQDKIDKLNFQLLLKENDLKHHRDKSETLEKQNTGLKKEIKTVESELNEKKSIIFALKDQIKYFKQQSLDAENKKHEVEQLRKEVESYKNIQTLLEASTEEVDEIISKSCEPNALITYICVMKREMTTSLNKRKELRHKLRSAQQVLTRVTAERNFLSEEQIKRKKLEEDLMMCEGEKMFLQKRVKELEENVLSLKKANNLDSEKIHINNDLNPSNSNEQNEVKTIVNNTTNEKEDIDVEDKTQLTVKKNETNSPYLPLKSGGVFVLRHSVQKRVTGSLAPSILAKRARVDQKNETVRTNNITYDGFGGHSKHEHFPTPSYVKMKKTKNDLTKYRMQKLNIG